MRNRWLSSLLLQVIPGFLLAVTVHSAEVVPAVTTFHPSPYAGTFTATQTADTCGEWGLSHPLGKETVSVDGDLLTYTVSSEGSFDFSRVTDSPDSPLVGAWFAGNPGKVDNSVVIVFLDSSHYLLIQDGDRLQDPNGKDGMERGTYSWDPVTGVYVTTDVTVDTNGEWGLSHDPSMITLTVDGDTLTFTDADDGTFYWQRLVPTRGNPMIGAWFAGDAGVANNSVLVAFVDDSHYLFAQDGDRLQDPSGKDGMERGSYTFTPSVKSLAVELEIGASDDVAVTGYYLSESSVPPSADAPGWVAEVPVIYTFPTPGAKVLYLWVKDADGNVSAGASTAVQLTICTAPASLTVAKADADGSYPVAWGASTTPGATYLLQEATNPGFTTGLRTAYTGKSRSVAISGRVQNKTYYYRVMTKKSSYVSSAWRTAGSGCAVPGTAGVKPPASVLVPVPLTTASARSVGTALRPLVLPMCWRRRLPLISARVRKLSTAAKP